MISDLPALRDPNRKWMRQGACREVEDKSIFFPDHMTSKVAATAVACCRRCPVQENCLRYAIVNREEHGIWGGLSTRARREIASTLTREPSVRERATYYRYLAHKKAGRADPVKETARELGCSTATVFHHIRLIKFKELFRDWKRE